MIGILRIKDAEGNWQEIEAIRGPKGDKGDTGEQGPKGADGTMKFEDLTDEQKASLKGDTGEKGDKGDVGEKGETGPQGPAGKDGKDGRDGQDYILTEVDKQEIAGMVDIPESERYNIGAGLYYDENVNELGVRVTKPIAFNNGALTINENDLFTSPIEEYAIDTGVAVPTDSDLLVFDVTPNWGPNQTNGWIEQIINEGMKTFIKFDVDNDWVFGGEYFPNYTIGGTALNGVSYEYVFDMSFVIGPNVQANTGIHTIQICYTRHNFTIVIGKSPDIVFRDISRVRFGSVSYNASLAHFWTGNNNQFNFYHNGNHPCVELNDEYIQNMIDNSTPDVDFSNYYTKEEIDNLLANLPTGGDIPSGEEVEW